MGILSQIFSFFSKNNNKDKNIDNTPLVVEDNTPNNFPIDYESFLLKSIDDKGKVDLDYIISLTNVSKTDVLKNLQGKIFFNYQTNAYELDSIYLSGNLYEKYLIATKYNQQENIQAILNIISKRNEEDVFINLGTPFVTSEIIDEFIASLFTSFNSGKISKTTYSTLLKKYVVDSNSLIENTILSTKTYGTDRINMFNILRKTLNHEDIVIYDYEKDYQTNRKLKILNKKETMLALEKQKLLQELFKQFINNNASIKEKLQTIFYEKYGCFNILSYNGLFLSFQDMNPNISLYDYQKNAILRILLNKNTLISHDVGTGKTFIMIASGMKIKQFHPSSKIMYVVPNSILSQWKSDFKKLYPNSKIKVIYPSTFTPANRQNILKDIKDNNYDAILISYSSFELIPLNSKYYTSLLLEKLKNIDIEVNKLNTTELLSNVKNAELNELKRYKKSLTTLLEKQDKIVQEEQIFFDDLNITTLYIDEAHNFKNLPLDTNLAFLRGINVTGSNKCLQMQLKIKQISQKENSHIIFATGTPIVNSITDMFVMQKYLVPELLTNLGLDSFDSWIGLFGELSSDFEIDVDVNQYKQVTRFSKFHNLKCLSLLINQFTDFYSASEDNLPNIKENETIKLFKTPIQNELINKISIRVDDIRKNKVSRKEDNLLKITTDGRKLALDPRLINENYEREENNKIERCGENIYKIYLDNQDKAQIVFSDIGTPKDKFNVYDALKLYLLDKGLSVEQIQYVHDATTDEKREELFDKVRKGIVKVLIGSTFKLGIGVNVQDHLIALHHLDVPWRPSDMIQREGRILRQGNENENVYIYRYVTEGTFDAYLWQILETKQRFISQLLSGCVAISNYEDLSENILTYGEVKALAIGNKLIKERFELANEINRLKLLEKQEMLQKNNLINYKNLLPQKIENLILKKENMKKDIEIFNSNEISQDKKNILANLIVERFEKASTIEKELLLGNYKGFAIVLPSYSTITTPLLLVKGLNTYTIEIKQIKNDILLKVDNLFKNMDKDLNKIEEDIIRLKFDFTQIDKQIETIDKHNYQENIAIKERKLQEIDNILNEDDSKL